MWYRRSRFPSDVVLLMKWRRRRAGIDSPVPPKEKWAPGLPWEGLRNFWYPVMPANELPSSGSRHPAAVRLMGRDIVIFYDSKGKVAALDAVCPHRGALLTLGWQGAYSPGTLTCRYHGWTFDGAGKCVAALTDGPGSVVPRVVETTRYAVELKYGAVWIYGGALPAPSLEASVPHLKEVMGGRWPTVRYWDWPVNYLVAVDNNADALHPSFAHRTCARHRDAPTWDYPTVEKLECGGILLGLEGEGPGPTGPNYNKAWEMHLPGYNAFGHLKGEQSNGSLFWAVPLDEGHVRMVRMTSFSGGILSAMAARMNNTMMVSRYGRLDNIYYCNAGPDAALAISQGPMGRIGNGEHLCRSDRGIVAVRTLFADAWSSERDANLEIGENHEHNST